MTANAPKVYPVSQSLRLSASLPSTYFSECSERPRAVFTNRLPFADFSASHRAARLKQGVQHRDVPGVLPVQVLTNDDALVLVAAAEPVYVVATFDIGQYVYYFYRELALESTAYCGKTYYSRVARVCKVRLELS